MCDCLCLRVCVCLCMCVCVCVVFVCVCVFVYVGVCVSVFVTVCSPCPLDQFKILLNAYKPTFQTTVGTYCRRILTPVQDTTGFIILYLAAQVLN